MFKAYVVDDEPLARDELIYILNRTNKVEVLGESDNIVDALADIAIYKPDIVFLDIQLDEENGLTLAKKLEDFQPAPAICFVTAYDEYALEAFEAHAIDYILKPYDERRIEKTLNKFINMRESITQKTSTPENKHRNKIDKITVTVNDRIVLINPGDLTYLEATDGKCKIKTVNNEYLVNMTLTSLEKKLVPDYFLRVHRSYIVNVHRIQEIEPWFNSTYNLQMEDGSTVPVSRTYVKDLKRVLNIH